jgi:serine/threonine-protein kinase
MQAAAISVDEEAPRKRGGRVTHPFVSAVDPRPLESDGPVLHSKQYRITALIGEGGMGHVYKAYDPMLERDVALKVLKAGLPRLARDRFLQEARHGARLTHPGIAQVYDLGVLPGSRLDWFSMEYLVGRDLEDLLWRARRQDKRLPTRLVLTAFDRVLGALGYAHDHGLVHRDVKPGNIFITRVNAGARFGVKLLDFGVALDRVHETGPYDLCGDPRYCPPEQSFGDAGLDHRADLYATGISLFETLTGDHPFGKLVNADHAVLLSTHCDKELPRISARLPRDWPIATRRALDVVIAKACAKDPTERFESAEAMRVALIDAFASSTSVRTPAPLQTRATRSDGVALPVKRRRLRPPRV